MLHGLTGDHQTVLTDIGGIDLGHGGFTIGDEVTETALIHGLESSAVVIRNVAHMEQIFKIFKETVFIDQWLREATELSFVMMVSERTGKIWHYSDGVKGRYSIYEEEYDKLILSPGARPVVPEFTKINSDRIFTLRTVEDTFKIKDYIKNKVPKSAVVIGGGFIGLEMAENLKRLGIDITVIQRSNQLLNILDSDIASFVHTKFKSQGIKLLFNANVKEITNGEKLVISATAEADEVIAAAKALDKIADAISGMAIVKELYVKGRLVNIVVK